MRSKRLRALPRYATTVGTARTTYPLTCPWLAGRPDAIHNAGLLLVGVPKEPTSPSGTPRLTWRWYKYQDVNPNRWTVARLDDVLFSCQASARHNILDPDPGEFIALLDRGPVVHAALFFIWLAWRLRQIEPPDATF
ncbi:hypothetical protein IF2G_05853 [Cordyceps javanica]|nr:hypothetical protein IF2G_05853 [Cordyceps javanica]